MKKYIHNPDIYRDHFRTQVGSAIPGFSGTRMHRQRGDGIGSFLGKLARKAIPLLISGVKLAAPHAKEALKGIAKDVVGNIFHGARNKIVNKKRKANSTPVRRRKKVKRTTPKDILDN